MTTSNDLLFTRGDYEVRVVEIKDEDATAPGATRSVFAVYHRPTGVRCGTSTILPAIVRVACILAKDTTDTLQNPDASVEANAPPMGGFGGGGFGFN